MKTLARIALSGIGILFVYTLIVTSGCIDEVCAKELNPVALGAATLLVLTIWLLPVAFPAD